MDFSLNLVGIGGTSIGGIGVVFWLYKFCKRRFSFFWVCSGDAESSFVLLSAICRAELGGYRFIRTIAPYASRGYVQGDCWLKPYKCFPPTDSGVFRPSEKYIYRIDIWLLFMMRVARWYKCKGLLAVYDKLEEFDRGNTSAGYGIEFFKCYKEAKSVGLSQDL